MSDRKDGWGATVYDGFGLETESALVIHHSCSGCSAPMPFDLKRVLGIRSLRLDDPRAEELTRRFGLTHKGSGEWRSLVTELGLAPHVVDVDCPRCGKQHIAIVGYGEFQPARYIAVLQGVQPL